MSTQNNVDRALANLRQSLAEIGALPFPKDRAAAPEEPEPPALPASEPERNRGIVVFFLPQGCEESDP